MHMPLYTVAACLSLTKPLTRNGTTVYNRRDQTYIKRLQEWRCYLKHTEDLLIQLLFTNGKEYKIMIYNEKRIRTATKLSHFFNDPFTKSVDNSSTNWTKIDFPKKHNLLRRFGGVDTRLH